MTQITVRKRSLDFADILIPDVMDITRTEIALSYTLNYSSNWDGIFVPLPAPFAQIFRGYGAESLGLALPQKDILGGTAAIRGKTRVLLKYSQLGWNDLDVIFLTVTANFPTLPSETGPIQMILTSIQYQTRTPLLLLSGTVSSPLTFTLPRVAFFTVIRVSSGAIDFQFGTGPGFITVPSTLDNFQFQAEFSSLSLDSAGDCTIVLSLNGNN